MKLLFGGSFDPVHNGHLQVATEFAELFDAHPVELLPCKAPVHKKSVSANAEHRLAMLRAATATDSLLSINELEIRRDGYSDTYSTLKQLKGLGEQYIVLGIGSDSASSMRSWVNAAKLAELCHLVVLQRPGSNNAAVIDALTSLGFDIVEDPMMLAQAQCGLVYLHSVTQLQISSSVIRERVARNLTIRYLVPDAVNEIICDNTLYS